MAYTQPLLTELKNAEGPSTFIPEIMSSSSTKNVQESLWFSSDIQLGAGVVIIQPSTGRVVLLSLKVKEKDDKGNECEREEFFLPKGRKDIGESLEQTALREGYEESGYRCTFLPLTIPTHAPTPSSLLGEPTKARYPNAEPFYVTIYHNRDPARDPLYPGQNGTQYLAFWYLAQIPHNAVKETNTQMADEGGYMSHLLTFEDAIEKIETRTSWTHRCVLHMAWRLWEDHLRSFKPDDGIENNVIKV